jgi:hypothetical protein
MMGRGLGVVFMMCVIIGERRKRRVKIVLFPQYVNYKENLLQCKLFLALAWRKEQLAVCTYIRMKVLIP